MRKWFILVLTAFLLSSCGLFRKTVYVPIEGKRDSIYIERIVVDTVKVDVPQESTYVVATDSSHLETSVAESDAYIDTLGLLHHSLTNKDVKLEKEIIYKEKEVKVKEEVPYPVEVPVPEKYVPEYYKKVNLAFWILVSLGLGGLILKLRFGKI